MKPKKLRTYSGRIIWDIECKILEPSQELREFLAQG